MGKKLFNIEEMEADEVEGEFEDLTEDQIRTMLPNFPGAKLADIIITSRYIGLYKELAVDAMQELSNRRLAGDSFQYEQYIDDNLQALPKIDFTLPNIASLLDQVKAFAK